MRLRATSAAARQAASPAGSVITVPGAPSLSAVAGNAQATITITPPASNGGAAISAYAFVGLPVGAVDSGAGTAALVRTITGLTNGQAISFVATATNVAGTGPASAASVACTPYSSFVQYDQFVGTPGAQAYNRTGWTEYVGSGSSAATYRPKFLIAASGKGASWSSGGVTSAYAVGANTGTADHSISVRLTAGTVTSAFIAVGCNINTGIIRIINDGVKITVNEATVLISPVSGGVDGTTVTVSHSNQIGGATGGAFPMLPGDVVKAAWDATQKKVSLYKNGVLFYVSAALTVANPGNVCLCPYQAGFGFAEVLIQDSYTNTNQFTVGALGAVLQRIPAGGTTVSVSGTYVNSDVPSAEYRVLSGETEVSTWDAIPSYSRSAGTWSGSATLPDGGPYTVQVRASNRPSDQFILSRVREVWVGEVIALYGQSNAERQESAATSAITVAKTPGAFVFASTLRGTPMQIANNPLQELANKIVAATGKPAMVIAGGVGGQSITALKPGAASGYWTTHVANINKATSGTGFRAHIWQQGESDVGMAGATYRANFDDIRAAYLALAVGRTAAQCQALIVPLGRDTSAGPSATDDSWQVMRMTTQPAMCTDGAGRSIPAYQVALAHPAGDTLHLTGDGYASLEQAIARSILALDGIVATDGRGPLATSATLAGDGLSITVAVDLNGCTSLTDGAATLTGWEVRRISDNGAVTISDARVSGSSVVLTLASAQSTPLRVWHLRNANPTVTNVARASATWATNPVYMAPAVLTT